MTKPCGCQVLAGCLDAVRSLAGACRSERDSRRPGEDPRHGAAADAKARPGAFVHHLVLAPPPQWRRYEHAHHHRQLLDPRCAPRLRGEHRQDAHPWIRIAGHRGPPRQKPLVQGKSVVRAGDAVFALGELRRGLPASPGVGHAPCQLARVGGVLLVSGASEREAKVLHAL